MLADVRSYAILHDSLNEADPKFRTRNRAVRELLDHKEVQQLLESFFEMLQQGIAARDDKWIEVGRRFCSAINSNFLSRQMNDIYSRRERSDARYIVACTRFRRHRVRCFNGTGGWSWSDGSLRESSNLRRSA